MATIISPVLTVNRNFIYDGESVCFYWADCCLVSRLKNGIQIIVTTDAMKAQFMTSSRAKLWNVKPCFHHSRNLAGGNSAFSGLHQKSYARKYGDADCGCYRRFLQKRFCHSHIHDVTSWCVVGSSFRLHSPDVRLSLNRSNFRTFFFITSFMMSSVNVLLNWRWIAVEATQVETMDINMLFLEHKHHYLQYKKRLRREKASQAESDGILLVHQEMAAFPKTILTCLFSWILRRRENLRTGVQLVNCTLTIKLF